jgi:hypothetical protein
MACAPENSVKKMRYLSPDKCLSQVEAERAKYNVGNLSRGTSR